MPDLARSRDRLAEERQRLQTPQVITIISILAERAAPEDILKLRPILIPVPGPFL